MKFILILLLSFSISSCANNIQSLKSPIKRYQFTDSNITGFDYSYDKFYLSAPANSDKQSRIIDQARCENPSIEFVRGNSVAYKVVKSFGYTDEEQIGQQTLECLFESAWKVYKLRAGKIVIINENEFDGIFLEPDSANYKFKIDTYKNGAPYPCIDDEDTQCRRNQF